MGSALYQLIYVSSASRVFEPGELAAMLEKFRAKNAALGISGLMFYVGNSFVQVLEGPECEVLELYGEIVTDKRHHGVLTLLQRPVDAREFPDWSMSFPTNEEIDPASLDGYDELFAQRGEGEVPDHAGLGYQFLLSLRDQLRRVEAATR